MLLPPFPLPTLLIRHAQTERNTDEIPRDAKFTSQVQLTTTGHKQRLQLAKWLSLHCKEQNWSHVTVAISPFERAQITAEPTLKALKEFGIKTTVFTEDLLREHSGGLYGQDSVIDNERWQKLRGLAHQANAYHYYTPPGGVALADTQTSQEVFHHRCLLSHRSDMWKDSQALLLFCHGIQGRLYLKMRLGFSWEKFWEMESLTNASVYGISTTQQDQGYLFQPTPRTR